MRLPKKITPDRLRESIVQVFYLSDIPFEPMVGYVHEVLTDMGMSYTNRPVAQSKNPSGNVLQIGIFEAPQHLYFNKEVKIQLLQNGSLAFNCINKYIGWENYFSFIGNVITRLADKKVIQGGKRVGIRYVSEFPNTDILEQITFSFSFQNPAKQSKYKSGLFRIEYEDDPHRIVLMLGSRLPVTPLINTTGTKIDFVSLIDIDVIAQDIKTNTIGDLLNEIDKAHDKEKDFFFRLLKPEYLETLNPEY